jgi:hypothetical protein
MHGLSNIKMITRSFSNILFICVVGIVLGGRSSLADLKERPPKTDELVGAWVGYEGGGYCFYRLVLANDGKGSCVALFNDDAVDSYLVEHWELRDGVLTLRLTPTNRGAEKININVRYLNRFKMEVIISGLSEKWERKVLLFNERELQKRIQDSIKHGGQIKPKVP